MNLMNYVIMSSKNLRIRQKKLIGDLHRLISDLDQQNTGVSANPQHQLETNWRRYLLLQKRTLLKICHQIQGTSAFWRPLLTVFFPHFIAVQCYLFYLAVFAGHLPPSSTYLYKLILCQFVPAFFFLLNQCAAVVSNNEALERACRVYYVKLAFSGAAADKGRSPAMAVKLLKVIVNYFKYAKLLKMCFIFRLKCCKALDVCTASPLRWPPAFE